MKNVPTKWLPNGFGLSVTEFEEGIVKFEMYNPSKRCWANVYFERDERFPRYSATESVDSYYVKVVEYVKEVLDL